RRHRRALDGDAALLFLLEVVGGGRGLQILGIVDVDDRVLAPRVVQDALRRRRLAGVDVGDDADIADIGEGYCASHIKTSMTVAASGRGRPAAKRAQSLTRRPGVCRKENQGPPGTALAAL